jgi:tetratricopeptide (TPR) repeat protein
MLLPVRRGRSRRRETLIFGAFSLGPWLAYLLLAFAFVWTPAALDGETPLQFAQRLATAPTLLYLFVCLIALLPFARWVIRQAPSENALDMPALRLASCVAVTATLLPAMLYLSWGNWRAAQAGVISGVGAFYERSGGWESAAEINKYADGFKPDESAFAMALGSIRLQQARATSDAELRGSLLAYADAAFEHAAEQQTLAGEPWQTRAVLHREWAQMSSAPTEQDQHLDAAESYYEEALRRGARHVAWWNEWATLRGGRGRQAEALQMLDHSVALDPQDFDTRMLRGDYRLLNRQLEAALADYDAAVHLRPKAAAAWRSKAAVLVQLERIADAIAANRAVVSLAPGDMVTHRNLALLLRRHGDLAAALEEAETALRLAAPEDTAGLNELIDQLKRGKESPS